MKIAIEAGMALDTNKLINKSHYGNKLGISSHIESNVYLSVLILTDYPDGNNSSEYIGQPTTYLPENFTYAQNLPCPERLPSMSKCLELNNAFVYLTQKLFEYCLFLLC